MILVDTNVLLDLLKDDPVWADWSEQQLEAASAEGPILLTPIVYAELSVNYTTLEALDLFVEATRLEWSDMPRAALFMAAKAFADYRSRGGARTSILPDFFIGAHAAVLGVPLLTRDRKRYLTYFPTLKVIAPPPLM